MTALLPLLLLFLISQQGCAASTAGFWSLVSTQRNDSEPVVPKRSAAESRRLLYNQFKADLTSIWSNFWYEDQRPVRLPTWRECKTKNNATLPISMEFLFSEYPIPLNRTVWVTPRITRFAIGAQTARSLNASTAQKFASSSSRTTTSTQPATTLPYGTRLEGTFRFRAFDKLWPVLAAKRVAWNFTQELAEAYPAMSWPWTITKIEAALLDWSKMPPAAFYGAMSSFRQSLSRNHPVQKDDVVPPNGTMLHHEKDTEEKDVFSTFLNKSWPIDVKALFGDQLPGYYSGSKKANVTIEILSDEPDALFMCMEAFLRFQ